jgi:hypothetical protein
LVVSPNKRCKAYPFSGVCATQLPLASSCLLPCRLAFMNALQKLAPAGSDSVAGNGASGGGAASGRTPSPLRTTSRLTSPKLESPADSGLDIYAERRPTALLLAVRTAANLETRHAHLQMTGHSRANKVFVRHNLDSMKTTATFTRLTFVRPASWGTRRNSCSGAAEPSVALLKT